MSKLKVKCMRCGTGMTVLQSYRQKRIYNRSFCMDPSISASQIFCDSCLHGLYCNLVYSVVDYLNESREIRKGIIQKGEKKCSR